MFEDFFKALLASFLSPLYTESRYWAGYLLSAVAIATVIFFFRQPAKKSWQQAVRSVFDRRILLHRSAVLDYRFAAANVLLFTAGLGLLLANVFVMTKAVAAGLAWGLGLSTMGEGGWLASATYTLFAFLALDAGNFVNHRLQHAVPALWEFHKVHHSAEVLTPITAIRVHPISDLVGSLIIGATVALNNGVFLYLFNGLVAEYTVVGVNVLMFLYYTIGVYHLAHSHVWLLFPEPFRSHFVSPALHMIHHSSDPKHFDKNFGFTLTIWDRLGGSLYVPCETENDGLVLGVGEDQADYQTLSGLYWTPIRNVLRMFGMRPAAPPAGVAFKNPS